MPLSWNEVKDRAVKAPKPGTAAESVAFLFERYQALTSLLPAERARKPRRNRGGKSV